MGTRKGVISHYQGAALVAGLEDAVLQAGGSTEDVLTLIQEGGKNMLDQVALFLLGANRVVPEDPVEAAINSRSADLRWKAYTQVASDEDSCWKIALNGGDVIILNAIIQDGKFDEESLLQLILRHSWNPAVRAGVVVAYQKITTQEMLYYIASGTNSNILDQDRYNTVSRLDQGHLIKLLDDEEAHSNSKFRAVELITDAEALRSRVGAASEFLRRDMEIRIRDLRDHPE